MIFIIDLSKERVKIGKLQKLVVYFICKYKEVVYMESRFLKDISLLF